MSFRGEAFSFSIALMSRNVFFVGKSPRRSSRNKELLGHFGLQKTAKGRSRKCQILSIICLWKARRESLCTSQGHGGTMIIQSWLVPHLNRCRHSPNVTLLSNYYWLSWRNSRPRFVEESKTFCLCLSLSLSRVSMCFTHSSAPSMLGNCTWVCRDIPHLYRVSPCASGKKISYMKIHKKTAKYFPLCKVKFTSSDIHEW